MWKRARKNLKGIDGTTYILFVLCIALVALLLYGYIFPDMQALSQNWSENKTVENNYNIAKTYFDNKRQGIINAYNVQIAEIHKNGLKTKDNFNGLDTDYSLGLANGNDDDSQPIIVSYSTNKNGVISISGENKLISHFPPELLNTLNKKINAKLAKIKHFYNARILNVYKALENNQKVDFISLTKDDDSNVKNISFNHADFDSIGSELNKNMLEENHTLIWLIVVSLFACLPAAFVLLMLFMIVGAFVLAAVGETV